MSDFPGGFLWGCATSAYQIEGSPLADGAGVSNWHRFSHTPGRVTGGDTGDVACDHYRRMKDDVALMKALGLRSYRFSIAWNRVLPEGTGRLNPAGLDFYARLVDALLEAGIVPMATVHHWDLPAALDESGGWLNPDSPRWFGDYAALLYRALDDRVPLWVTVNEPWVIADGGFMHGVLAPGHRSAYEAAIVAHRLLQGHAEAVRAYRALGRHQVGLVVNIEPKHLAPDATPADRRAAELAHAYMNRQYLDPAIHGKHPPALAEVFGDAWPAFDPAPLKTRVDFLGLNYYTRSVVRHDPAGWPVPARSERQPQATYTETGWEVHPPALTETLLWLHREYGGLPLYVTENGAAFYDPPAAADGRIDDPLRVHYLRTHVAAVRAAIAQGADVRGYYAWSLFDNLEWAHGYAKRFGLVHVDFATMTRTPKASAHWYRELIAAGGRLSDNP